MNLSNIKRRLAEIETIPRNPTVTDLHKMSDVQLLSMFGNRMALALEKITGIKHPDALVFSDEQLQMLAENCND